MIEGEATQPYASPEEALAHYGVKGMKWGVRNEEDEAGDSSAPKKQGLSRNQKVAIGVGLAGAAGVVGFVAYKHYSPNQLSFKKPSLKEIDESLGYTGPLGVPSAKDRKIYERLHNPENLVYNIRNGYADVKPVGGITSKRSVEVHRELTDALDAMRQQYPSVRDLKIEVLPLSANPFAQHRNLGATAMVETFTKGEARIYYNDLLPDLTPEAAAGMKSFIPNYFEKGHIGYHEMGHVLAVANGAQPSPYDFSKRFPTDLNSGVDASERFQKFQDARHTKLLEKHNFSFQELFSLSEYAGWNPAEGMAELFANYQTGRTLTPEQRVRAKALFDEMGGLS